MKFLFETFINAMRCLKADSLIRKFGEAIKTEKIPSLVLYFIINNKTKRTVDFLNQNIEHEK